MIVLGLRRFHLSNDRRLKCRNASKGWLFQCWMASVSQHLLDKNTDGSAIHLTLMSVVVSTLQGSDDVGLLTVYAILIGTLEGNMVKYATQWSFGSLTHISRMSKIRCYATDVKKNVYVSKRRQISVEFQTCKVSDFGVNFCSVGCSRIYQVSFRLSEACLQGT